MKLYFQGPSPLAGCLFGLLIGIVLTLMLTIPNVQQRQNQQAQHYGQALASMAASQAIDASFNHDLVRLQVILEDVMKNPATQLATIHDVENKLLVQAGDSRTKAGEAYTAPIVLHDSIAGYVSVSLSPKPSIAGNNTRLFAALLALVLALLAWELHRSGSIKLEPKHQAASPLGEEQDPFVEQEPEDDWPKVYSIIHLKNLKVLQQQLNGENLRLTLGQVEQTIADVLALYNGASFERENDQYRLTFIANDATNEALFRAACSAWLIVELSSIINNIPLDLAAFVSANQQDLIPANLPIAGLVLETQAAADELISRRLKFLELGSEDGRKVVSGFEQPFQSLLEKQRAQLAQLC
ncbi:hypothetical protein SAMN02745866_03812 [Alteromonadaceae bacterium Bs31]|nr:hypothetical protein SAMN02745866_03812 [Alteromonadaceae bacterium Bs31]